MGKGYLKVQARTGSGAIPLAGAEVHISYPDGRVIYRAETDRNGDTGAFPIQAPDARHTLDPDYRGPVYTAVNVLIKKDGFITLRISNVQIFDTATTILLQNLEPFTGGATEKHIEIPPPCLSIKNDTQALPRQDPDIAGKPAARREYPGVPLKTGSAGDGVMLMQICLSILRSVYPALPLIAADGVFGPETRDAAAGFQKLYGLIPDGIIGPDTWYAVIDQTDKMI